MALEVDLEPFSYDYAYLRGPEDGNQYYGRLVTIDELQRLYVEKRGRGHPILFVPGYGGDASYFLNLGEELAGEFTCITYDRRGNSRSPRGWLRVTLEEQADDIAKVLDLFGLERAIVMASSNGNAVATTFMLRHRERLQWGVLHEPYWSPTFLGEPLQVRAKVGEATGRIQETRPKDCGEIEAQLRCLVGDSVIEAFTAETRRRIGENAETGALEREVFSKWSPSQQEWQALAQLPLTLLCGDTTLPWFAESVAYFERQLGIRALAVPGGHGGFIDHAEGVAEVLRPILRNVSW